MNAVNRRHFLSNVGRGMLVGAVGATAVGQLTFTDNMFGAEWDDRLKFGGLEPLVDLMQNTPPEKLLPELVLRMKSGLDLKSMTSAAALANARRFGGEDYVGYHTFMALAPAYAMAKHLPKDQAALPVLKVIYRNAERIQEDGGGEHEHLHELTSVSSDSQTAAEHPLQAAVRDQNREVAEQTLAALIDKQIGEAYNHLQFAVQDEIDVHRVVLPWRAWSTLDIVGSEHALTLLRQSVRFCVSAEKDRIQRGRGPSELRVLLPRLIEEHNLLGRPAGTRAMDDAELTLLAKTLYKASREEGAAAVAAALSEGFASESIGEAMSLAASMLVLHDPGRKTAEPGKPIGSIHGASVGVHASDSANAWRNISRVTDDRNRVASLIAGAFHTAGQSTHLNELPWPLDEHLKPIESRDPAELLRNLDGAIRENNQARATALVHRYSELGQTADPVFDLLLRFATSEDGQLHAEKYYWTVFEEFGSSRKSVRWQHLCALARVTASEFGGHSKGYQLGRELLRV
jgi:hypothetical protein